MSKKFLVLVAVVALSTPMFAHMENDSRSSSKEFMMAGKGRDRGRMGWHKMIAGDNKLHEKNEREKGKGRHAFNKTDRREKGRGHIDKMISSLPKEVQEKMQAVIEKEKTTHDQINVKYEEQYEPIKVKAQELFTQLKQTEANTSESAKIQLQLMELRDQYEVIRTQEKDERRESKIQHKSEMKNIHKSYLESQV